MSNCWGTYSFESNLDSFAHDLVLSGPHSDGPLLHGDLSCNFRQFRSVQFHQWNFSIRHPICYVIINDEADVQASVISIENIIEDEYGSVFIVGHSYHNESAFFVHPCNSDEVLSINHHLEQIGHNSLIALLPNQYHKVPKIVGSEFNARSRPDGVGATNPLASAASEHNSRLII
ncbi:hypothetical protein OUZ56_003149 [Daphnia magna]|uniref:Uncharacterized protein n=1 Tax=Daphnia magna TaxID=35525 RepID=A0ABR0A7V7_9CRUS|nr:hypothetical protein OUZ56_003149 [Daphnia magna]